LVEVAAVVEAALVVATSVDLACADATSEVINDARRVVLAVLVVLAARVDAATEVVEALNTYVSNRRE